MRRATIAICLINAAFVVVMWMGLGGSDPEGNALAEALIVLLALVFVATTVPAFILAVAGRLPRVAMGLALTSSFLCLMVYAF